MREFTFSDLSRRSGDVLDAAMVEPIRLMKRGKPKVVMMPTSEYERLKQERGERTAFTLAEAPEEDIRKLTAGFRRILDEAEKPDE